MNSNKILGYILLFVGLILVIFAIFQSYNIFTGKASAPLIFKTQTPLQSSKTSQANSLQDLQGQLKEEIAKQINQIVAADTLPKILNLLSWSILAGILIFGGGQIASVGIKLIK